MNAAVTTQPSKESRLKRFWQERVVALIAAQFTQGFTPQKISLTVTLGLTLGVFPIFGATTTLCALAGCSGSSSTSPSSSSSTIWLHRCNWR
jgi:hypothetical protein